MPPSDTLALISVSPARLVVGAVLLGVVAALAALIARRRAHALRSRADTPLRRLRGFHIFGPDDEDELSVVHVPVLLGRPVRRPVAAATAAVATDATVLWSTAPSPWASLNDRPEPPSDRNDEPDADSADDAGSVDLGGTPVTIGLGAARRTDTAPEQRPPRRDDILLVEDDETIATMYAILLDTRGYATRHASDGVEGIAMLREALPSLILLDMMMPRMDGLQFLRSIRDWPPTSDLPVVILSNVADRPLVEKAMSLGALEYLVKAQTRPQVLLGALPHWLRGNRALTTLSARR